MTLQLAELYLTHLQNQRGVQKFSEDVVAGRKFLFMVLSSFLSTTPVWCRGQHRPLSIGFPGQPRVRFPVPECMIFALPMLAIARQLRSGEVWKYFRGRCASGP